MVLFNQLAQFLCTKELPFEISALGDTVRMKNQYVSWLQNAIPLVVIHFLKNSQRKSGQLYFFAVSVFIEQWLRLPGVRHTQFSLALLPGRKTSCHEAAFNSPLANNLIHLLEYVRRLQFLRRQTSHDSNRYGAIQRGSRTLTTHVSERYPQLLRSIAQKLIQVPTHFPRRQIPGGHIESIIFAGHRLQ